LKKTQIVWILAAILSVALLIIGAVLLENANNGDSGESKPEAGKNLNNITVDGIVYTPKKITNYLIIGIDEVTSIAASEDTFPSADFLILLTLNHTDKTYTVLTINRDTVTDVTILDSLGRKIGTSKMQIALSYAKGNTTRESCLNTARAVSDLLYGMPIHYSVVMTMGGVPILNGIGGSGVTLTLDKDYLDFGEEYVSGAEITLDGNAAMNFVRARMGTSDPTNIARMERQKLYMAALMKKLASAEMSASELLSYEEELASYVYYGASMGANQLETLYTDLCRYQPASEKYMFSLEGEVRHGETYIEYYCDETALKKLITELYYEKR